jgi:hypothetical protein
MPPKKIRNLFNTGAFSNDKKLPTYKKTKCQDKVNVSHHNIGGMGADSTHRKPPNWSSILKSSHNCFTCLAFGLIGSRMHIRRELMHDGILVMWVSKQYKGHWMPPKEDMLAEYNKTNID